MRYLLLIYDNEQEFDAMPEAEREADSNQYFQYTNDLREAGAMLGGEALMPTTTATTVRVRDGKRITTHGPFAETKEQLGGFYIIQAENLDKAIDWAAKIPGATHGSIEIRPIMEFGSD
jgi:hypothetical protein